MRTTALFTFIATILAAVVATAVDTEVWLLQDFADYERAKLVGLALSSDGRIRLAPVFRRLLDSSCAYLWALAEDSRGNVYAAGGGPGGSGAAIYVIPPQGEGKLLLELEGLAVHALAVDRQDRLYAATSPDGRVYRIAAAKAEPFYDPKVKYIWAMAVDNEGRLYLATGDRGEIHRVQPDGRGEVFFTVADTHARCLTLEAQGNLIVGTEPGGVILRVTPQGRGFVLYQAPRREITAVAVARDGSVYAAGVGARQPAAPPPPPVPAAPQPQPSPLPTSLATPQQPVRPAPTPSPLPPLTAAAAPITGGSEVYRIDGEGAPRKVWSHAQDVVYAVAFDAENHLLLGTGNKGTLYRLESEAVWTALPSAPPTQITGLLRARNGAVYVATGNLGQVYRLGPELESEGTLESEPLDAGRFSYWGQLRLRGELHGGQITIVARSGNLERPQRDWSPWSEPLLFPGGAIVAPPARFLQWRATLQASRDGRSPELRSVEIAYRNRNVAPVIEQIEVTPANYRFQPPTLSLTLSQTITLPPLGRKPTSSGPSLAADSGSLTMHYAKGHLGARWAASDENGDTLTFRVEIRGRQETQWKLLRDKLREKYFSWDSTAFADGEYRLRVIASDAPDNPPDQALTAERISEPFLIDNTPPAILGLEAALEGDRIHVRFRAQDALSPVARAECSINGGEWVVLEPRDRIADSPQEDFAARLPKPEGREFSIAVRVTDDYDNQSVAQRLLRP